MRDTNELSLRNSNVSLRDGLTYLLIGGGIGAALALLFAPKSGSELRGDIADVSRRGYDATLEKAMDIKTQSADVLHTVLEKADAVYDFAANKLAKGEEAVVDAVAATSGAINDGIDRLQNEAAGLSNKSGSGRRASSIM